jgi:hypothetical protein
MSVCEHYEMKLKDLVLCTRIAKRPEPLPGSIFVPGDVDAKRVKLMSSRPDLDRAGWNVTVTDLPVG